MRVREVLKDAHFTIDSDAFEGGSIFALLSRIECDLLQCRESPMTMKLSAHVRFSAVTLYVPEAWRVTFDMRSGGGEPMDRRVLGNPPEGTAAPELHITGALLGARFEIWDEEEKGRGDEEDGE